MAQPDPQLLSVGSLSESLRYRAHSPTECHFEYHYVLDESLYAKADQIWLNDQVDQEDVDAMGLVRANIESGAASEHASLQPKSLVPTGSSPRKPSPPSLNEH